VTLHDWVQRDPTFRGSLRAEHRQAEPGTLGTGQLVLTGVFAQGSLVGLFRLLRAWLDLQKATAKVRVVVNGTEVEASIDGRFDPAQASADLLDRALREAQSR
jgi:hypothetical protein